MKTSNKLYMIVLLFAAAVLTSCSDSEVEQASESAESKRVALFDGKTMDGWTVINCEAIVDNGDILLKEGNGLVQTQQQYGNFILEFECIALRDDKWDSGPFHIRRGNPQDHRDQSPDPTRATVHSIRSRADGCFGPGRFGPCSDCEVAVARP